MGHSLGAELVYNLALKDTAIKALVISGFAYKDDASTDMPQNMLMIFGKYDEFRQRMTATRDFEHEWMQTPQTRKAFPVKNPQIGKTGDDKGSDGGVLQRQIVNQLRPKTVTHQSDPIGIHIWK